MQYRLCLYYGNTIKYYKLSSAYRPNAVEEARSILSSKSKYDKATIVLMLNRHPITTELIEQELK